ncbi:hypothetical protein Ahy_A08g039387 [Arachis hypogaea]|uniref:Uncharacterized protein n=1 Tax=Arachis hypogaea TaxID=3818 RepID=A0A445BW56_ARAHY|nr:hypothetical protein Ahy_A08g039387 [Arachis hypogaea]
MSVEMEDHMISEQNILGTETTESDHYTSESETEDDSEDSTRKQPNRKAKKHNPKKKVIVEDSSHEQAQSYHDEFLRENNEKSAAQGVFFFANNCFLFHKEKEANLRSTEGHYVSSEMCIFYFLRVYFRLSLFEENMMVVREETQSKGLAIVPIQVCLPLSQTTSMLKNEQTPETENEPTPLLQIEGTTKSTPEPPNNLKKAHPHFPQLHLKCNNPAPEDAAALLMMAWTASYIPKADPLPSFSLGLTNSSQEEIATQEGASTQEGGREKTPETPKLLEQLGNLVEKIASSGESGGESSGKFETPARINQNTAEIKVKCYIWGTRLKKYADGRTNEYDNVCTLIAQDKYILTRMHLASLKAESYIEVEIVSAMCLILNQQNDKRFQEENMAIAKHPKGEFISPKTNKEFRVEDYPMFIPFIDAKKLTSYPYGYIISRMRVYAGGAPLKRKEKEKKITPPYVNISGQKTSYECAIYLELIEPENIKRAKYEWENWTQDEVDHYRVEYASRILFSEINKDRAEAIRGSNAIRLSKPSSVLLSSFCQIDSNDIETE